jgi:hypothetical protein
MEHDNGENRKDFPHGIEAIDLEANANRPAGRKDGANGKV